jgi:hypothetical protein
VESVVAEGYEDEFNHWYEVEHVPDAVRLLPGILRVTRWASITEPKTFCTAYEFADRAQVTRVMEGPEITGLIAEFDRKWGTNVRRVRCGYERTFLLEPQKVTGVGLGAT